MRPSRSPFRKWLATLLVAIGSIGSTAVLPAQAPRTHFTYHLFVDPVYGDDALAAASNPTPNSSLPAPLQSHPTLAPPKGGILQQSPYAYRTVGAALGWINALLSGGQLPWPGPNGLTLDYIVIHCLPGLYGPRRTTLPTEEYDSLSGLPWNGEHFPLDIPAGVSIQGTSALDTIFDARLYETDPPSPANTSIFTIGGSFGPGQDPDFSVTFIDSVTIRGARGEAYLDGCGILIHREAPVNATIGNCFIYNNTVGIAVVREDSQNFHSPRIINNTLAWNEIGLWTGYISSNVAEENKNELVLLNNIFDCSTPLVLQLSSPPVPWTPPYAAPDIQSPTAMYGESCFEGVCADDLTVQSKPGCLQAAGNFNAYESSSSSLLPRYNISDDMAVSYPISSWPLTHARPASGTGNGTYTPRVDLYPFTKSAAQYHSWGSRGDLYINDVFRNGDPWTMPQPGVPRISQHDFRIAPMARLSGSMTSQLSPLVNVGIDVLGAAAGTITMANGQVVDPSWIPGLPPAAEDVATLNVWDWDCNGYGNPRVQEHVGFPNGTPCVGNIDLGASELGTPLVSGFVDSTRIFSRAHPAVAAQTGQLGNQAPRDVLYFFNVYPGPFGPAPDGSFGWYLRPQFNFAMDWKRSATPQPGTRSEWYAQLGLGSTAAPVVPGNPYDPSSSPGTSNYTDGDWELMSPSTRRDLVLDPSSLLAMPFPLFMRNLVCDASPHLYHDIFPDKSAPDQAAWQIYYPEWDFQYTPMAPTDHDLFQSDPWYRQSDPAFADPNDNQRLYYDPSKRLRLGLINPPKTVIPLDVTQYLMQPSGPPSISYLFWNDHHGIGIWDLATPIDHLYQVNDHGWGDMHGSPFGMAVGGEIVPCVPQNEWQGLRANLELYDPDNASWGALGFHNDLATFLIVQGSGTGVPSMDLDGGGQALSSTGPQEAMLPPDNVRLESGNAVQTQAAATFNKLVGSSK